MFGVGKSILPIKITIIKSTTIIEHNLIISLIEFPDPLPLVFLVNCIYFTVSNFKIRHICVFSIKENMKSNKNIVLVGMMGSGKSSIGKRLAKEINLQFLDIDKEIEEEEKLTISEIFISRGERYFRNIEEKISIKILKLENKIISLGGGGFINSKIRRHCNKNSLSFWLNWKNETIISRIIKSKKRPIAMRLNKTEMAKLIKERSKFYCMANYTINCDNLNKIEIIKRILNSYEKN